VETQALMPLVPGSIWHARQAIRLGPVQVKTRATFVKLADGSLWVHSPIAPTTALMSEIQRIGTVRYVIAPNKSHYLFFAIDAGFGAYGVFRLQKAQTAFAQFHVGIGRDDQDGPKGRRFAVR
jgi:hypothetical protein